MYSTTCSYIIEIYSYVFICDNIITTPDQGSTPGAHVRFESTKACRKYGNESDKNRRNQTSL